MLLLFFLVQIAFASSDNAGTSSAEFLKIQHDARATALGYAVTPLVDDVDSLFWNPASLSVIDRKELTASYLRWLGNANSGSLGAVYPVQGIGTFGLGFSFFSLSDIPYTTVDHRPTGTFSNNDLCLLLGFGGKLPWKLFNRFHFGSSLNIIKESFYDSSRISLGFNFGMVFNTPLNNLDLAFALRHIGFSSAVTTASDPLPLCIGLGASYKFYIDDIFTKIFNKRIIKATEEDFIVLLDFEKTRDDGLIMNSGVEIGIKSLLYLRSGYQLGTDLSGITAGCGLKYKVYKLDYAFVPYDLIGNTHRVTFNMAWGTGPDMYNPYIRAESEDFYSLSSGEPYVIELEVRDDSPIQDWMVIIFASSWNNSDLARVYKGEGPPPARIRWDGKDKNGNPAGDGTYNYFVLATDSLGNRARSPLTQFEVDSSPPEVKISVKKEIFVLIEDEKWEDIVITLHSAEKEISSFKAVLYLNETQILILAEGDELPEEILWNGKTKEGNRAQAGVYSLKIFVKDPAGNETEQSIQFRLKEEDDEE